MSGTRLVAGVDSSTQACKVVVRDADTGALLRSGRAGHPDGTEIAPERWWEAFQAAVDDAGGLDDIAAVSIAGQQHGMVALDDGGEVVREAILWNDTRSADAAEELITEMGDGDPAAGAAAWATAVGSVPVASLTVTKLRWLASHEPNNAARVAAVALPHDWLTWRVAGGRGLDRLVTDRSEASGTGYWSPRTGEYRRDLLVRGLGHDVVTPTVLGPADVVGEAAQVAAGALVGPGAGDNAGAALALGMRPGDIFVSVGTSGVVASVSRRPTADPTGLVNGFADATGYHLPLCCTLNASRVLDAACRILQVDHTALSDLAMSAPPGADGLVLIPYLEGERAPNKPNVTGALHGLRLANTTPGNLARAAVEGMLCALADGLDELQAHGVPADRVLLIGGGARIEAVRHIAPEILGLDVEVPEPGEYVADGAARQAAWVLSQMDEPTPWEPQSPTAFYPCRDGGGTAVRERYAAARHLTADRWDR